MKSKTNIAVLLIILAVLMFFMGAGTFTHLGPINPIIAWFGMISFFAWFPVLIVGLIVLVNARRHMNDEMNFKNRR